MDTHELLIDRPVTAHLHERSTEAPVEHLVFDRSFPVPVEQLVLRWMDAASRKPWMALPPDVTFTIVQHTFPVFLRAVETDGVSAVEVVVGLEEDGYLAHLHLHARPLGALTMDQLIECGYADRWEERLYALADVLLPRTPTQQ
jgi:hypothetical protein